MSSTSYKYIIKVSYQRRHSNIVPAQAKNAEMEKYYFIYLS